MRAVVMEGRGSGVAGRWGGNGEGGLEGARKGCVVEKRRRERETMMWKRNTDVEEKRRRGEETEMWRRIGVEKKSRCE